MMTHTTIEELFGALDAGILAELEDRTASLSICVFKSREGITAFHPSVNELKKNAYSSVQDMIDNRSTRDEGARRTALVEAVYALIKITGSHDLASRNEAYAILYRMGVPMPPTAGPMRFRPSGRPKFEAVPG